MKLPCLLIVPALASLFVLNLACSTAGSDGRSSAANLSSAARFEIEVKLITAGADACQKLGLGDVAHVVSADAAKELINTASATCGIVSRPRIVVTEGGVAFITTTTRTPYLKDYDADAQPVMDSIEHGVHIEATPKSSADDRANVAFSIEVSNLLEPMRSAEVTLPGRGKTMTVQLPLVVSRQVTTSFVLGADEAAILPMGPTTGDDPVRAVVLRVRRIV